MKKKILKKAALAGALLMLVTVLAGIVYAWESKQKIVNEIYGEKTKLMSVELLKLEKQTENADAQTPLPDTIFYLFRENGTQIGGQYVTDENGRICVSLQKGNYYFEESSPKPGYTFDLDENGNEIRKYPFSVSEEEETIVVTAYNIPLKGSLLIRKTVENSDGSFLTEEQQSMLFTFTVTFSDEGNYTYRIDQGEEEQLKSGETLLLCDGQTAVFEEIPVGVLYHVEETATEGYVTQSTGHQGNITTEQSIAHFINCRVSSEPENETGSLTITKEVRNSLEGQETDQEFTFTIQLDQGENETFTLKNGERKTFSEIPSGTRYSVREEVSEGYQADIKEYSGQVIGETELLLPFVNYFGEPVWDDTGNLTIRKEVVGTNSNEDQEFRFLLSFDEESGIQDQIFGLQAGESYTIENLPAGTDYMVTEIDTNGYLAQIEAVQGSVIANRDHEIIMKNAVPEEEPAEEPVILEVQKVLTGEVPEEEAGKEFSMMLIVNGESENFVLQAGETRTFELPKGASYEVRETDYYAEGFSQSIDGGSGTADGEKIVVTVTNAYVGEVKTVIRGEKHWVLPDEIPVSMPESITIFLRSGDFLLEEKCVTPDENGVWSYSFSVPKYQTDGSLAEYTIEEEPIEHFRASYEEYDIVNTYIVPIQTDPPILQKTVDGKNAPKSAFQFVFQGNEQSPMPEGAEGNRKILTIEGEGTAKAGTITFSEPGEYRYTIYELNGGENGWTYDSTVYTVVFLVTEKEQKLFCEQRILKGEQEVTAVEFQNHYDEKVLSTEKIRISGSKTWDHGENPESEWPSSIIVYVYGNEELVLQRLITEADHWKYSFEVPKYDENGEAIRYRIDESKIAEYSKQIMGYDLINVYNAKTDQVDEVKKDENKANGTTSATTGDRNHGLLWMLVIVLVGIIFLRRRKY